MAVEGPLHNSQSTTTAMREEEDQAENDTENPPSSDVIHCRYQIDLSTNEGRWIDRRVPALLLDRMPETRWLELRKQVLLAVQRLQRSCLLQLPIISIAPVTIIFHWIAAIVVWPVTWAVLGVLVTNSFSHFEETMRAICEKFSQDVAPFLFCFRKQPSEWSWCGMPNFFVDLVIPAASASVLDNLVIQRQGDSGKPVLTEEQLAMVVQLYRRDDEDDNRLDDSCKEHEDDDHDKESWLKWQCAICLDTVNSSTGTTVQTNAGENMTVVALPCHHRFHRTCIVQWLTKQEARCPLCNDEVWTHVLALLDTR